MLTPVVTGPPPPVVTGLIGVGGRIGGVLGAAMTTRGVLGAAMARGMPGAAMTLTVGGVPGTAMTTGGVPRQLANRDNQPAVAGLLGWPIVTITINPRSRGCLAGPWFARRDRDNVCAASEVNSAPWVEANRGAMVMAHTRVCVFFEGSCPRPCKSAWLDGLAPKGAC